MKHTYIKLLSLLCLVSSAVNFAAGSNDCCNTDCVAHCNAPLNHVVTCYLPRSQSRDNAYKNAGVDPYHQHLYEFGETYEGFYTLNVGVEYTQSFHNKSITRALFGPAAVCTPTISSVSTTSTNPCNTGCNSDCSSSCNAGCSVGCSDSCASSCNDSLSIKIVGSALGPNGVSDLVADNFLLPTDFSSVVTFNPKITNINVPIHFYAELGQWCATTAYCRIYAPITNTRWKLNASEAIVNQGSAALAAGVISPVAVPASSLYQSFLAYTSGGEITLPASTPTVSVQPLDNQRILASCNSETKTGLADLRAELGFYFLLDECYHLAVNVQAAAPTGNRCSDCLLFGPIVGNGHFWEIGGGINGHWTFWASEDDEQQWGLYVDGDVTHLCKQTEERSFDLAGKPLSRYIFVEQMVGANSLLTVGGSNVGTQFGNVFAPLANVSKQKVDVSFDVQGDVIAKLVYTCHGFNWEIGYNFWGRSCQNMEVACCGTDGFNSNGWALRGDAHVFGFDQVAGSAIDIAATADGTTAFSVATVLANNSNIDHPVTPVVYNTHTLFNLATGGVAIYGSQPPSNIETSYFDLEAGQRSISHKVFTHFNYTWLSCECYTPYLGIGASGEFGVTTNHSSSLDTNSNSSTLLLNPCCSSIECENCPSYALSQWAVWFKLGVSFN